jgi:FMN reductase
MKLLIISCSLSTSSHSAVMAARLAEAAGGLGDDCELVDLRTFPLPFCDAGASYEDANAGTLTGKVAEADAVCLAVPIYNYDVGGAARNLIAMTGSAWNNKIVGLVAAAGGQSSYMSIMPIANSLMLDFRCVIVPRYVYASRSSFADGQLVDEKIDERLTRLAHDLRQFAIALGPVLSDND